MPRSTNHRHSGSREIALETALADALCWMWAHSSMPEAEAIAERLAAEVGMTPGPCRDCGGYQREETP